MRHIIRGKMTSKRMMYLVKVAIRLINSCLPTIWRDQIGGTPRQHSVYYPRFTGKKGYHSAFFSA